MGVLVFVHLRILCCWILVLVWFAFGVIHLLGGFLFVALRFDLVWVFCGLLLVLVGLMILFVLYFSCVIWFTMLWCGFDGLVGLVLFVVLGCLWFAFACGFGICVYRIRCFGCLRSLLDFGIFGFRFGCRFYLAVSLFCGLVIQILVFAGLGFCGLHFVLDVLLA